MERMRNKCREQEALNSERAVAFGVIRKDISVDTKGITPCLRIEVPCDVAPLYEAVEFDLEYVREVLAEYDRDKERGQGQ